VQSTPGNTRLRNNALLGNWDIKYLLTQSVTTDVIVIASDVAFWRCPTLTIHSFTFMTRHHRLKPDCSISRTVSARLTDGCLQTICYWTLITDSSYGWERGNNWPKFSVILLTMKMYHFQLPLRSSSTTLGQFQSRLKTTLFRLAYGMWLWHFC